MEFIFAILPWCTLLLSKTLRSSVVVTPCMCSSSTEDASLIHTAVFTKLIKLLFWGTGPGNMNNHWEIWYIFKAKFSLFTCLKFGMSRSSSSRLKKSQTIISSAVSKLGPYSTGNTFCQAEHLNHIFIYIWSLKALPHLTNKQKNCPFSC